LPGVIEVADGSAGGMEAGSVVAAPAVAAAVSVCAGCSPAGNSVPAEQAANANPSISSKQIHFVLPFIVAYSPSSESPRKRAFWLAAANV
jgi:hypothetical protein